VTVVVGLMLLAAGCSAPAAPGRSTSF